MRNVEYYRHEADLLAEAALCISLRADKDLLLSEARTLRERADRIEAEHANLSNKNMGGK